MSDPRTIAAKARAEVDNVIDEVVLTIENGVTRPDGSPGFEPRQADRLRATLRDYAEAILAAARQAARGEPGDPPGTGIGESVDPVVGAIRRGLVHPEDSSGFGPAQADEMHDSLEGFGQALVTAAADEGQADIEAPLDQVVQTIRTGLFRVYGRASYAAITGDQLEAYLATFSDAVLTVVEKERAAETPLRKPRQ